MLNARNSSTVVGASVSRRKIDSVRSSMTTLPTEAGNIAAVTMPPTAISLRPSSAARSRSTWMAR